MTLIYYNEYIHSVLMTCFCPDRGRRTPLPYYIAWSINALPKFRQGLSKCAFDTISKFDHYKSLHRLRYRTTNVYRYNNIPIRTCNTQNVRGCALHGLQYSTGMCQLIHFGVGPEMLSLVSHIQEFDTGGPKLERNDWNDNCGSVRR